MKSLIALVSGFGWHVADLQRAADRLDVALHASPLPRDIGLGWHGRGGPSHQGGRARSVKSRRRAGADDAARKPGAGRLPEDALHRVAADGVPVLNPPRAVEAAVDKYLTLALLAAAGMPVPGDLGRPVRDRGTVHLRSRRIGGDVVVKPLFGSEGRGWSVSATASCLADVPCTRAAGRRSSTSRNSFGIPGTISVSSC